MSLYMGRRPDRLAGASACCRRAVVVVIFVCVGLLVAMVATAMSGMSLGAPDAAAPVGGGVAESRTTSFPARYSGGGATRAETFRSSKRRIPKGPDPIHNRRAGKTTIAPRRRD